MQQEGGQDNGRDLHWSTDLQKICDYMAEDACITTSEYLEVLAEKVSEKGCVSKIFNRYQGWNYNASAAGFTGGRESPFTAGLNEIATWPLCLIECKVENSF